MSTMETAPTLENRRTVPRILSDEQVAFFVENGYLVLERLVTDTEVEELRRDTAHLARGGYPCENLQPLPAELTDDEALRRILCIHQPHFISPVIEKYVKHEKICGALSQITAAHLPFWDGSVKCMQSMLFVKPPTFQGQAWHQDEIYIPTRDRSLIGAWIALDDATIENGCLWVIPGSHKAGYLYPQRKHDEAEEYDFAPQSYGFDESLAVPVEVPVGSVVFFNGYLLHKSLKNRSEVYRRVLVSHYMNAWSLLPWSVKDGESVATADRRNVIPVAGADPYAWKGYDNPPSNVWLRTCKATEELKRTDEPSE
ncbi:phytanoyl-CoA dioxygenase family protein [Armatimonas rosea]|uniref:Ectoine hydroxylase-related dioxygenase (Phytanoyl-CoA dioxygenase family) n=1 Tax=Armatimonas rosea TaxID=685828 RepID=A0A7W9SVT0_ARMRO|nr:phytanoyl-CoA dioxygenase family protein [Armatimonas rosea]MBB6052844.1 ectoine hydroxylase-related dioxygenase (phytanoyl-CoA dioxygenase family) [Armatimonas rosea]